MQRKTLLDASPSREHAKLGRSKALPRPKTPDRTPSNQDETHKPPNHPSSATRHTRGHACNQRVMAGSLRMAGHIIVITNFLQTAESCYRNDFANRRSGIE